MKERSQVSAQNLRPPQRVAQCVVFGAVMSEAAMLDAVHVLELDVWGKEKVEGGRRG